MHISALTAVAAAIVVTATTIVVTPATAQTEEQWVSCYGIGVSADPDPEILVGGCTAVIRSGIHGGEKLVKAFTNRGRGYWRTFQYERAFADFDQAIALDSNYLPAYDQRGRLYWERGQFERAREDLDQLVRLKRRELELTEDPCPDDATDPWVIAGADPQDRMSTRR